MKTYPLLAARIFNTPLLIHPQKLDAIIAGIGPRLLGLSLDKFAAEVAADVQTPAPNMFATSRYTAVSEEGGYCIVDGVAVVSMIGPLVHRRSMQADCSMLWGYGDTLGRIEHAIDNPDVHAIAFIADTPGGEAQGAFDAAQRLFELRGAKPIRCIADGMIASAGYLIGCASDEVIITRTGYAGSIGVVMRHVDYSKGLADDGVSVTHVYAGAHKIDGNPFEPLPEAVRADMQSEVDGLYQMFVSSVAQYRGLTPEAVRGTEARTYRGDAAVAAGLADRIGTTDGVIAELVSLRAARVISLPPANSPQGAPAMSGTQPTPPAALSQADLDRARAEGHAAGATEGAATERARVSAIQAHPEAVGRSALATMCIAQGLSAEQAGALLAAAPKDQPAAAANPFAAAMGGVLNPLTKPDAAQSEGAAEASSTLVTNMVSLFQGSRK